jgi:hypothetical protein
VRERELTWVRSQLILLGGTDLGHNPTVYRLYGQSNDVGPARGTCGATTGRGNPGSLELLEDMKGLCILVLPGATDYGDLGRRCRHTVHSDEA